MNKKPNVYWVDLFCGAGGTTTGIHLSNIKGRVIACVNHDSEAIRCHKENHKECYHFTEDIRDFKVISKLKEIIEELRAKDPYCVINIWASLECTHFSNAKGGLSRDADSRTLANHLFIYLKELECLYIENVREFLSWGPLDKKGKPVKSKKGIDYRAWRDEIISYGYDYDYQMLNSADFGAHTSRDRYFGVFVKKGIKIKFPKKTHSKKSMTQETGLKPWKSVKELLDLNNEGRTIFGKTLMGKDYAENTLKRIYAGLIKFSKEGLFDKEIFLTSYYGNGGAHDINEPCNTLTTKERFAAHFINYDYTNNTNTSVDSPAGTITTIPKHKLVSTHFTFDTQFNNVGRDINRPSQTLIARMDKKPVYLVRVDRGITRYKENDCNFDIKNCIIGFMSKHGISDIKIRMLTVDELKSIQGFPSDFKLTGTKTNNLKFIGNSVVPLMSKLLVECNYESIVEYLEVA